MNREELKQLAEKILTSNASDEEIADYIARFDRAQESEQEFDKNWVGKRDYILKQILSDITWNNRLPRKLFLRIAVAAAVIFLVGFGALLLSHRNIVSDQVAENLKKDFKPGKNKAILTLSNGKQLVLDNANRDTLANESGVVVKKNSKGQLVYDISQVKPGDGVVKYNTVTTPRGAEHQIILPDGSHVWLNAASSLTFPTAFNGTNRTVVLTGEGYFEVTKDKTKPFRVKTALQTIEVLGTHFNVNAYNDEASTATTLLEGSVKINNNANEAFLKPGQQSQISTGNSKIVIDKNVDIDMIVAWKNDEFNFNNSDTKAIFRQISRWYDVDIEYQGDIPNYRLNAVISRNVNASEVLKILNYTGLKFKIEGRKIIVQ